MKNSSLSLSVLVCAFGLTACPPPGVAPVAPAPAPEDCLSIASANVQMVDEGANGYLITDGRSRMTMADDRADAKEIVKLATQHTQHCFIGRDNRRPNRDTYITEYWTGDSGAAVAGMAHNDCLPYDPSALRIEDEGAQGFLLTDGRSRMAMFDDRADAERGLLVARQHTQHCFIGRDNRRADRDTYITEYWRD